MQVAGGQLLAVLFQVLQQLEARVEQGLGGRVQGGAASAVLVRALHQAHHEVVRGDVVGVHDRVGGNADVGLEGFPGLVDLFGEIGSLFSQGGLEVLVVDDPAHHLLAGDAALGVGARGELVAGGADAVSAGEQAVDRGHAVVDLAVVGLDFVLVRHPGFVRAGDPDAAAAGVGTEQVRLGRHDLGALLLGLGVRAGPEVGLADAHVEEVFPGFALEVLLLLGVQVGEGGLQGAGGIHVDGAAAFAHFTEHHVVTQAGRDDVTLGVAAILVGLQHGLVGGAVIFALGIGGFGLEQQEPSADRAVTVLEAGGDEAVFHHRHLGADLSAHGVGGTSVPNRVPGAAHAFTGGAGAVHVDRAAAGHQDGVGLEDEHFVFAGGEADRTGDAVGGVGVQEQLHDEDALHVAILAQGVFRSLGHDALVGLAVDHDLPAAGADGLGAGAQGHAFGLGLGAVEVVAVGVFGPAGQAPLFEQVDGIVDVTADAEDQVFADQTHKVGADHLDVVVGDVLADVGIDGGQALRDGAGALEGGLVEQHHADATDLVGPAADLIGRAAAAHAATDHEDVNVFFNQFRLGKGNAFGLVLHRNRRHDIVPP